MPLAARLKLNSETPAAEQAPAPSPRLAPPEPDASRESAAAPGAASLSSPVLTILPEETVLNSAPRNGHGDGSGRPKILQEVVTANNAPQNAEEAARPAASETKGDAQEKPRTQPSRNGNGFGEGSPSSDGTAKAPPAGPEETAAATHAARGDAGQERGRAKSDGPKSNGPKPDGLKPVPGPGSGEVAAGNGVRHAPYQNGEAAETGLAEAINIESLQPDPEDDKIGPNHPTLLERLRSVGEKPAEGEKSPPPPSRGLG